MDGKFIHAVDSLFFNQRLGPYRIWMGGDMDGGSLRDPTVQFKSPSLGRYVDLRAPCLDLKCIFGSG